MTQEHDESKKIIIDESWKEQAHKEKEKLAAQEKAEEKEAQEQGKGRGPLPQGDLSALVSLLATQAMFSMGAIQVEGQERGADLDLARYNIDMLAALEEKTKGNLTEEEASMLEGALSQLRMLYVQLSNQG